MNRINSTPNHYSLVCLAWSCPPTCPPPNNPINLPACLQWTVYRGVAYDLTSFIDRHPAGNWLINLAIGRDCTALFESYHLRPEVAVSHLRRLPVLEDFPVDAVPRYPSRGGH